MAITITGYHNFLLQQMNGAAPIDFDTDTLKVALVTNTYSPSASAHNFFDDITNEVSGTNYTAGGATLASKTVTLNAGIVTFDAADVTWTQSGTGFSNARYAIIYKSTGTASTSPLVAYVNFGADVGNTVADLVLVWAGTGIISTTWS